MRNEKKKEKEKGWTLVEILIALTLVGMMIAIAMEGYSQAARKAVRKAQAVQIARKVSLVQNAAIDYYAAYHVFPQNGEILVSMGLISLETLQITNNIYVEPHQVTFSDQGGEIVITWEWGQGGSIPQEVCLYLAQMLKWNVLECGNSLEIRVMEYMYINN